MRKKIYHKNTFFFTITFISGIWRARSRAGPCKKKTLTDKKKLRVIFCIRYFGPKYVIGKLVGKFIDFY